VQQVVAASPLVPGVLNQAAAAVEKNTEKTQNIRGSI